MRARRTTLLVIAGAFIGSPVAAFEPLRMERHDVRSPNGMYVVDVDPARGVNTVHASADRATPLWSFPLAFWAADSPVFVSNDGAVVAVVQWSYVWEEHLADTVAVWFWTRDGLLRSYPVAALCPDPRRTWDVGPGPAGEFWRTWRAADPQVLDGGEDFEVETTGGWTYTFRLADGAVTGRRLNDWVVYRRWFWAVVLGVPAVGLAGFVVGRRRRPTWPRERRALAWAGMWSGATLTIALLTSLGVAARVGGGDAFSRRYGLLRAIIKSPDARACWYAGVAVSVAVAAAAGVYTFNLLGVGRVRGNRAGVAGTTAPPAVPGEPPPPLTPA